MNHAVLHVGMRTSMQVSGFNSSGCQPRNAVAESYGNYVLGWFSFFQMDLIVYLKKESNNTLHGSWIQTHVYKSLMGTLGKKSTHRSDAFGGVGRWASRERNWTEEWLERRSFTCNASFHLKRCI